MSEVITFINASAKRLNCFIEKAKDAPDAGAKKRLIRLCETRWVERHGPVSRFRNFFEEITIVLKEISMWRDTTASSKAWTFKASILKHEFVIALLTMENVLSITKPVSEKLQTVDMDIIQCLSEIHLCVDVLKIKRENVDSVMIELQTKAEKMLKEELQQPRIT